MKKYKKFRENPYKTKYVNITTNEFIGEAAGFGAAHDGTHYVITTSNNIITK